MNIPKEAIVPANDTEEHLICPRCEGRGQDPIVRQADGETIGYRDWPCHYCCGQGTIILLPDPAAPE